MFIKDDFEGIIGVNNEKTICYKDFDYNFKTIRVLITGDKEKDSCGDVFYNIYVIDNKYIKKPLNCLKLQEPKELLSEEEISNDFYLERIALEHYLWDKYSNNHNPTSFCIERIEN